ncbi:Transposon Tf2-9 polyprotein [Dictyocoela muelleri]|nr:Transposon Tf2-9 polyprotein [Dictyocoela muelleri]
MGKIFSNKQTSFNFINKSLLKHKSILLNFITLKVIPQGLLSLNSESEKIKAQYDEKQLGVDIHSGRAVCLKEITFYYSIPGSEEKLPFIMPRLTNLESQDLEIWIQKYRNLVKKMAWNNEVVIHVLEELVDEKYHEIIESKKTIETKFQSLISAKYPKTHTFIYLKNIENIKQENYVLIEDYYNDIQNETRKFALCNNLNETETKSRIQENFMRNLHPQIAIYFTELEKNFMKEILEKAKTIEMKLIEQGNSKILRSKDNENLIDSRSYVSKEKVEKYCKFHRSTTHDDKECFSQRKNLKIRENNKKNELYIKLYFKNYFLNLTIDTGSNMNFISYKKAKCIPQKQIKCHPITIILGNGIVHKVDKFIYLELSLQKSSSAQFKTKFFILEKLPCDIIIGLEFLQKFRSSIDLENMKLKLDDIEIPIYGNEIKKITRNNYDTEEKDINKFIEFYKNNNPNVGEIPTNGHVINLIENKIVQHKGYSVPIKCKKVVEKHIRDLISNKIIRRSKSYFSSPAFIIPKPDKTVRLVVDYRELNKITQSLQFPYPKIRDQFNDLKGAQYFSKIDLHSGYYQLKIADNDIYKTAFTILNDKYEFLRLPFGLKNAPFHFQQAMSELFGQLDYVKIFLDDILIFSKSKEEHDIHLLEVLKRLWNAHVKINFKKSEFFKPEILYLGQIINGKFIRPDITNLAKLKGIGFPKTKKQLMKIIGSIQWFRPYITNLSDKLNPLTSKLKNDTKFQWNDSDSEKLKEIYKYIEKQPKLHYPNLDDEFILFTDASDSAIGSVLIQNQKIISIYSNKLSEIERRYTSAEKEMLAIYKSLLNFRNIILGSKIIINTDNKNIISDTNDPIKRIERWKMSLQEFDYSMNYFQGKLNRGADALSRMFQIRTSTKLKCSNEHIRNELLINGTENNEGKFVFTNKNELKILEYLHETLGHPGIFSLYNTLKRISEIKNLRKKISLIVQNCQKCQTCKHSVTNKPSSKGYFYEKRPNIFLSTDIVGPYTCLQKNEEGRKLYVITITDICTRFTKIKIIKKITSKTVFKALKEIWFERYGNPNKLLTDHGKQYVSKYFNSAISERGIKLKQSTIFNPTGNAISERINKTINEIMRMYSFKLKNKEIENMIENRLNLLTHSTLKMSPYELFLGNLPFKNEPVESQHRNLQNANKNSKDKAISRLNENNNENFNKPIPGDYVYVKSIYKGKSAPLWEGPYRVDMSCEKSNRILVVRRGKLVWYSLKTIKSSKYRDL